MVDGSAGLLLMLGLTVISISSTVLVIAISISP
jgi:hypothetical protein